MELISSFVDTYNGMMFKVRVYTKPDEIYYEIYPSFKDSDPDLRVDYSVGIDAVDYARCHAKPKEYWDDWVSYAVWTNLALDMILNGEEIL